MGRHVLWAELRARITVDVQTVSSKKSLCSSFKRPTTMASSDTGANGGFTLLPTPIKGDADWRDFRALRLSNGVTICLVHDPQAKTTAAGATIAAGAAYDTRSLSGMAHFCEHMCFLGSKKYPGKCVGACRCKCCPNDSYLIHFHSPRCRRK